MATILKYSKDGKTKCAGGVYEIVKVGNKFQAIDGMTGLPIGGLESKKAYADINIINACKLAGLAFTRENTNFTH